MARRSDEPTKSKGDATKNAAEPAKKEAKPAKSEQEPSKQADAQPSAGAGNTSVDAEASAAPQEPATTSPMATKRLDDADTNILAEETMDRLLKERGLDSLGSWVSQVNAKHFPPAKDRQFSKEVDEIIEPKQDIKSFFFDDTDPDQDSEDFEEFNEDDMTEMAHAKLHEIQEMRQYQRLAVWELPLLSSTSRL